MIVKFTKSLIQATMILTSTYNSFEMMIKTLEGTILTKPLAII